MFFIIVGILLIVALAPYTYFSVRKAIMKKGDTPTRSLYLFPIVQVGGGLAVIIVGIIQVAH